MLTLEDGPAGGCSSSPRVPVLACRDALVAGGARVETITAYSDADIDAVLDNADARVIVAAATDGEVRAVVRRLVRRYAPAPSKRPDDLPADRTLPDLPPLGILPMGDVELVARLGLPREPAEVAAAVLAGRARRLDLLRNDGGSVTLHGTLLGGSDDTGRAVPYAAQVNVDDTVLSDGTEPLLATAVANADGYATVDDLPLIVKADAADGVLDVAVALPVTTRRWYGRREVRVEVRRARGRAVAVHPRADVPFVDDGVAGTLGRKRTWWMERGAWAVFAA
nr:diacylglycerol kinase family protein [Planosporangium mesophilum]